MPDVPEFRQDQILAMEKELLGLYISGHPLASISDVVRKVSTATVRDLSSVADGASVTLAGVVVGRKQISTRAGQPMAFVQLEDMTGQVEVVVFPRAYEQYAALLAPDAYVAVRGRVDIKEDGVKVLADTVSILPSP